MYNKKTICLFLICITISLFLFIRIISKKALIEKLDGFDPIEEYYPLRKGKNKDKCLTNPNNDFFRCRFINHFDIIKNQCNRVTRISFGSCNTQFADQSFWNKIIEFEPDLWIWMGDNVYMDYFSKDISKVKRDEILNDDKKYFNHMKNQYLKLLRNKHYRNFLKSDIDITGIWDDHDYYKNNKGNQVSKFIKKKSRNLFFQFINYNKKREEKEKPFNQGIYRNKYIKDDNNNILINLFLLDVRSFKSKTDILGKKQWSWLRNGLLNSNAKLNIIVSGVQIIADRNDTESWSGIGKSKEKLINLLNCTGKRNTILLSGDIHKSCVKSNYGFFEITASPLTNFVSNYKYKNHYNNSIGDYLKKHNYGFLEVHWNNNFEQIDKIICGFNETNNNQSHNLIEIK